MKVIIYKDEMYPVYYLDKDLGYYPEIEIPEEIYNRYCEVEKEFNNIQHLLSTYYTEC